MSADDFEAAERAALDDIEDEFGEADWSDLAEAVIWAGIACIALLAFFHWLFEVTEQ